jgi:hypothetical protein
VVSGLSAQGLSGGCGGQAWQPDGDNFDNPLIISAQTLGRSYMGGGRAVVVSLDGRTPYLVWLCSGLICSYSYESGLTESLRRYVGAGTLRFSASAVRMAGLDITKATRSDVERELTSRGAQRTRRVGGPLLSAETYNQVSGVPGLDHIELTYLVDRVASVRYPIATAADYAGFAQSLDERYGAGQGGDARGCETRTWKNGGVAVLGELCAKDPQRSGFTFINTGAADIVQGVNQLPPPPISGAKPPAKPKTDMY